MAKKISTIQRIRAARRAWKVGRIDDLSKLITNNDIDYGVTVNHDTSLCFAAVFAAIKLLSENIASLPKSVKLETPDGAVSATDHPVYRLLRVHPNDYTDVFTFWFSIVASVLGWGNAFAVIEFDNGVPKALHFVPCDCVAVGFNNGKKTFTVNCADPKRKWLNGTYLNWEVLHFMYYSEDGIYGLDPITVNASAIGRGLATQKFSADFYRKGGQIKGVLETDGSLGETAYKNFLKHYREAATNFSTPLLEYGVKYKGIGISPIAAQLIQSETLSIQDIARIFSVPPHLLAEMTHATFSNIEQQNIFFGVYSLRPLCKRLEQQLENKLFTDDERAYSVKFDLRGMMRGDDTARANYYASGINAGWMTPNEAREQEEMIKLPGLDKPRIPLNYVEVGEDEDKNA